MVQNARMDLVKGITRCCRKYKCENAKATTEGPINGWVKCLAVNRVSPGEAFLLFTAVKMIVYFMLMSIFHLFPLHFRRAMGVVILSAQSLSLGPLPDV